MILSFHKSSYSTSQENCVEVAPILSFGTSSYSDSNDNCVEVAEIPPSFRTSSHSSSQENCVEVADLPTGVAVRDSKRSDAGHLAFPAADWAAFLRVVRADTLGG